MGCTPTGRWQTAGLTLAIPSPSGKRRCRRPVVAGLVRARAHGAVCGCSQPGPAVVRAACVGGRSSVMWRRGVTRWFRVV